MINIQDLGVFYICFPRHAALFKNQGSTLVSETYLHRPHGVFYRYLHFLVEYQLSDKHESSF